MQRFDIHRTSSRPHDKHVEKSHDVFNRVVRRLLQPPRQTLKNTLAVLAEAGGKPEHIVRMTWYILDKKEYLGAIREVGAAYRELIGRHYPTMAVVQVSGLIEDEAKLEIETTAVVPEQA